MDGEKNNSNNINLKRVDKNRPKAGLTSTLCSPRLAVPFISTYGEARGKIRVKSPSSRGV